MGRWGENSLSGQRQEMAKNNDLLYGMTTDGTSVFIHINSRLQNGSYRADFVSQNENMECGAEVNAKILFSDFMEFETLHPMDKEEKQLFAKLLTDVKSIDEIGYSESVAIKERLKDTMSEELESNKQHLFVQVKNENVPMQELEQSPDIEKAQSDIEETANLHHHPLKTFEEIKASEPDRKAPLFPDNFIGEVFGNEFAETPFVKAYCEAYRNNELTPEAENKFDKLFDAITPKEKEVCLLHYKEGLTMPETASCIESEKRPNESMTAEAARKHKVRAIRKFRNPAQTDYMKDFLKLSHYYNEHPDEKYDPNSPAAREACLNSGMYQTNVPNNGEIWADIQSDCKYEDVSSYLIDHCKEHIQFGFETDLPDSVVCIKTDNSLDFGYIQKALGEENIKTFDTKEECMEAHKHKDMEN